MDCALFEKSSAVRSPVATSAIRHAAAMGRLAQDFFLPFCGIDTRCEHQNFEGLGFRVVGVQGLSVQGTLSRLR